MSPELQNCIEIKASRVPRFKPGKALKDAVDR
ncbi:MAG: HU family DNA-binding protein [Kofleriaceae bacterium]|nr:HU family DNA-binding protein [Candidatus Methylomirabilis lanthanidiphila]